jgi:hypothetical protein
MRRQNPSHECHSTLTLLDFARSLERFGRLSLGYEEGSRGCCATLDRTIETIPNVFTHLIYWTFLYCSGTVRIYQLVVIYMNLKVTHDVQPENEVIINAVWCDIGSHNVSEDMLVAIAADATVCEGCYDHCN